MRAACPCRACGTRPDAHGMRGPWASTWTARRWFVEGEELMGRCIQHECDHLEGHLYLDRLDRKNRAKAMKELRAQGL